MRQASHSGLTDGRTLIGNGIAQKTKCSRKPESGGEPGFLTHAYGRATPFCTFYQHFRLFRPNSTPDTPMAPDISDSGVQTLQRLR